MPVLHFQFLPSVASMVCDQLMLSEEIVGGVVTEWLERWTSN